MLEPQRYTEWLHDEVFLPTIVVIGTEVAKTRCREATRLSLAELFSPFGGFYRKIPVTYQSLEKQMHVENLRVRFADADSSTQWSSAQADKAAHSAVEAASPKNPNDPIMPAPPGPWFEAWRLVMFRSLRWSEHEGLDQPVTALLVVSSKERDPVFLFEQLLHSSNMPQLCTQGVLDPVPARAAVLLHDASDPESPSFAELQSKLDLVRARFSPHLCLAVQINRGSEAAPEVQNLFRPYVIGRPLVPPPPPPPDGSSGDSQEKQLCQHITKEDLDALALVAAEIVTKSSVPWIEMQLQQLEAQISQTRKGFRNQLKYLWRKPKEEQPSSRTGEEGAIYPLQTIEGQMRLAGDLAFHLHDYETALGYYRSVVSDFKQDKSWKHAAGAYEMWGVCCYISGGLRSEAERCMENAADHYLKAAAGRHAMRAVILHLAMVSDYKETAGRLMKVNGDMSDTGLRSALILEQAAQLYSFAGSSRKSSFHMVLAGHTFNKHGFKRLALRCYSIVAGRYKHKRWYHITDHFNFTMARQAFGLGFLSESMEHFVELLNSFTNADKKSNINADRETTYLKEFLFVARNWIEKTAPSEKDRIVNLQIPLIGTEIMVTLPCDLGGGSSSSASTTADEKPTTPVVPWESLGEKMVTWREGGLSVEDRLELQWRNRRHPARLKDAKVFDSLQRVTAVGAEVSVEIELSNPMRVELELTNLRLGGELVELSKDTPSLLDGFDGEASDPCQLPTSSQPAVEFSAEKFTLGKEETKKVRLTAIGRREGLLKIQRLSWSLFDQVQCIRDLNAKGRRLKTTWEQRSSDSGVYSIDKRLEVKVRTHVPQVQAHFEGWPDINEAPLLLGELRSCFLVLEGDAKSLRIFSSHSAFMVCSAPESESVSSTCDAGVLVCNGPLVSELRFPVMLRADAVGRHIIRTCILAEAAPDSGVPKSEQRQWITLEQQLAVQPSISCTVSPSISLQDASRFIFSVVMENKSVNALEITRVRCLSQEQQLDLQECVKSSATGHQAGPGQLVHLLFSLQQGAIAPAESQPATQKEERMLLAASRKANTPVAREYGTRENSESLLKRKDFESSSIVDIIVEWATSSGQRGEVYSLRVPYESPSRTPGAGTLALHVLAQESAVLTPELIVPVTLNLRNTCQTADVSFYFVAENSAEIVWLGCERSETIQLRPQASHTVVVHAYFSEPGVFNLNRFRLHIVNPGIGQAEQAPPVFLGAERLIHVKAE